MAKAASPIRLERNLMDAAKLVGVTLHRTPAEQVEYWADIGRKVSGLVDPVQLLAVKAGLMSLRVEETKPPPVDPDAVFRQLAQQRESGALQSAIASGSVRYQASTDVPGMLEACHPDGRVVRGRYKEGEFLPEGE
jgi:hypothetical protein